MFQVTTEQELKAAIKSKVEEIEVTGSLAMKLIHEFNDIEEREKKKTKNKLFKAGLVGTLLFASGPIGWLLLGGTTIGAIMTKDDYKKYDISTGPDTVTFIRK